MKSKLSLVTFLALAAIVGWVSAEAYHLRVATQQVATSQQLEMRVSAKVEAARAKQLHLANTDASARGPGAGQK